MKHPSTQQVEAQLKQLHLQAFLQEYQALAQVATQAAWSYEAYLAQLLQAESARRLHNRRQRRLQEAHFPLLKELADFDFTAIPQLNQQQIRTLARGDYLAQAESVLFVGSPGLGKTHIAIGLGLAACRQDHRVRFYAVTHLVNELQEAQANHQLPNYLEKALRHQLVILDEFGYVPFSPTGAQLLFQFCAALQERVSLIVTTNLPFSEWGQVLGDERLAAGLLDRLTFRAHIIEFIGDSFRFRHGLQQYQSALAGADPLVQPETAP
ncbi:IS21-like element helper ATPase IstB [Candidatus Saccharibacteria bacterium]|nr:IS21-like element helper ATPase IstB [Candidatus Saccharibacteria bacterium]